MLIWLAIIVCVSVVGKANTSSASTYVITALRALAMGTLLGDALLHIIPSVNRSILLLIIFCFPLHNDTHTNTLACMLSFSLVFSPYSFFLCLKIKAVCL